MKSEKHRILISVFLYVKNHQFTKIDIEYNSLTFKVVFIWKR